MPHDLPILPLEDVLFDPLGPVGVLDDQELVHLTSHKFIRVRLKSGQLGQNSFFKFDKIYKIYLRFASLNM